jgi:hypothetical protein
MSFEVLALVLAALSGPAGVLSKAYASKIRCGADERHMRAVGRELGSHKSACWVRRPWGTHTGR